MSDNDDRRTLIIDAWAAAWDRGEVEALDALLAPGYRRRSADDPEGQDLRDFKASILATRSAFPDLTTTIDEILVEGDRAAVRWHSQGRHEHSFLGVPATHRTVRVSGATFARFVSDRVVEEFVTWDPRALLSALGIITVGQDRG
ncbi:ester cyclase [Nocardioides sp.]|uniref:ester cyclase n=1 Tax=Nocardioides sp. TaxID=35761 RepID=UPI0027325F32|nr:ester cyclase [Nocardioides sp.]MDP3890322.1 ester cyclase [Nocardioides sp.]